MRSGSGAGSSSSANSDPAPGRALDRDPASHRRRELGDDREPEPRPDRTVGAVALPEVEALERALEVAGLETGAVVDARPAGPGEATISTVPPSGVQRIAFSTRFETACSARPASAIAPAGRLDPEHEIDAVGLRLRRVTGHRLARDLAEVDRPRA